MLSNHAKRYIRRTGPLSTYLDLLALMNYQTRTCFPSVSDLADRGGVDVTTIRRRLRYLEALGVITTTFRKYAYRSNHTSVYTLPVLDDDFFLSHPMPVGPCKNARVKQLPEIKKQTTTSRAVARREKFSNRVSPPRPVPDAEVIASEQRGRELRREHWRSVKGSHRNWREWREGRESQAARMRSQARIGTWDGPVTPFDPAVAEAFQQRELGRLERIKAEEERVRLERVIANQAASDARERAAGIELDSPEMIARKAKLERMIQMAGR
jgi:hypothetical protein